METYQDDPNNKNLRHKISGNIYQVKLTLLIIWRALKNVSKFRLRAEVKEAEQFDDALFYHKSLKDDKFHIRYVQAKHALCSGKAELRYDSFFDNRFDLTQYFIAFRKIKQIFTDEVLDDFIICSNIVLPDLVLTKEKNKQIFSLTFVENTEKDMLFDSKVSWKRYNLKEPNSELEKCFVESTDLFLLAEELVNRIIHSEEKGVNEIQLDLENHWLLRYHLALKKENVFEDRDVVKFKDTFVNDIREEKKCKRPAKLNIFKFQKYFMQIFQQTTTMEWDQIKNLKLDATLKQVFDSCPRGKQNITDAEIQTLAATLVNHALGDLFEVKLDNDTFSTILKDVIKQPEKVTLFTNEFLSSSTSSNKNLKTFYDILVTMFKKKLSKDFFHIRKLKVTDSFESCFHGIEDSDDEIDDEDEKRHLAVHLAKHFVYKRALNDDEIFKKYDFYFKRIFKLIGMKKIMFKDVFFHEEKFRSFREMFLDSYISAKLKTIELKLIQGFGEEAKYNFSLAVNGISLLVDEILEIYINKKNLKEMDKLLKYDKTKYGKKETKGLMEALCGVNRHYATEFNMLSLNDLPLEAYDLKQQLQVKMGSKFADIEQYQIKITNYLRCYNTLAESSDITKDMKDFCDQLLIVETPSEKELATVVSKEIGQEFDLFNSDTATTEFFNQILNWIKAEEDQFFDASHAKRIRKEMLNGINSFMQNGCKLLYCEQLKNYNLVFNKSLDDIEVFLTTPVKASQQPQILHIKTTDTLLTAIKLEQTLRMKSFDNVYENYLFYPLSTFLYWENAKNKKAEKQKSASIAFELTYNLMVIVDDDYTSLKADKFFRRICEVLTKNQHKKIILISSANSNVIDKLKERWDESTSDTESEKSSKSDVSTSTSYKYIDFDDIYKPVEDKEEDCNFLILAEASQKDLLKKEISFYGKDVTLSKLLDSKESYKFIDQKFLRKLINKDKICIGKIVDDHSCYISRRIWTTEINNQIFSEKEKEKLKGHIIAINGYVPNDVQQFLMNKNVSANEIFLSEDLMPQELDHQRVFVILEDIDPETRYRKLCDKYSNVHFLTYMNNKLILNCSNGTPVKDLKFCASTNGDMLEERFSLPFLMQNQAVVFIDKAGMGKSTILTSLTKKLQKMETCVWVTRIDLNYYSNTLAETDKNNIFSKNLFNLRFDKDSVDILHNRQDYAKVILRALINENENDQSSITLEDKLFRNFFKTNKMVIMFDGYDEINEICRKTIKHICIQLKTQTKNHIWITSRSNFQQELENALQTFAYPLVPFSQPEQVEFLIGYWKKDESNTSNNLKEFAKKLIEEFTKAVGNLHRDVIGIPLQTKMIAEIFQSDAEKILLNDNLPSITTQNLVILKKIQEMFILYDTFVTMKLDRYFEKKGKMDLTNSVVETSIKGKYAKVRKYHEILGLLVMTNKNVEKFEFPTNDENLKVNVWISKHENRLESIGFVDKLIEDDNRRKIPLFYHQTYAEYFAACYLTKRITESPEDTYNVLKIIENILKNDVRIFASCINFIFTSQTVIPDAGKSNLLYENTVICAVQNNFYNCIKCFVEKGKNKSSFFSIKNIVHYAVIHKKLNIVIFVSAYLYEYLTTALEFRECGLFYISQVAQLLNSDINHGIFEELFKTLEINGMESIRPRNNINVLEIIYNTENKQSFAEFICSNQTPVSRMVKLIYSSKIINELFNSFEESVFTANICIDIVDFILKTRKFVTAEKLDILERLYKKVFAVSIKEKIIYDLLTNSVEYDCLEIFQHFYEYSTPKCADKCFSKACEVNSFEIVKYILEHPPDLTLEPYIQDLTHDPELGDVAGFCLLLPFNTALRRNSSLEIIKWIYEFICPELNAEGEACPILEVNGRCMLQKIKYLIHKGAQKTIRFMSITEYAIRSSDDKFIRWALKNCMTLLDPEYFEATLKSYYYDPNFDINKTNDGKYRLHETLSMGHSVLAEFLIKRGADVNAENDNGETPLSIACKRCLTHCVKILLSHGAQYDKDEVILDVLLEHPETKEILQNVVTAFKECRNISSTCCFTSTLNIPSSTLNTFNSRKETIWHVTLKSGVHEHFLEFLLSITNFYEFCSINKQDKDGNTILHLAVGFGYKNIVHALLIRGAYFNILNNKSQSPESIAKEKGDHDVEKLFQNVRKLFENIKCTDAQIKITDNYRGFQLTAFKDFLGKNLLHYSAENKNIKIAKNLLQNSSFNLNITMSKFIVYINNVDNSRRKPLCYAIEKNDMKMMDLLLKNGAQVDTWKYKHYNKNECISFIIAVDQLFFYAKNERYGDLRKALTCTNFKLELSTVVNMRVSEDLTLIKFAEEMFDYDLVKFLLSKGAIISNDFHSFNKKIELLYSCINKFFNNINEQVYDSKSIIKQMEKFNDIEIIKNVREPRDGNTLLHSAAVADEAEVFEWLWKNGADINSENFKGKSVYDLATEKKSAQVLKFLTNIKHSTTPEAT